MNDASRRAALAVAERATGPDDLRQLLAMLGLTEPAPKRRGRPQVDHGHGDHRTYIKGCRCGDCREAHRVWCAKRRAAWKQDPSAADRAGHGKRSTYKNYGCRCTECCAANTADHAAWRARRREKQAIAQLAGGASS